MRTSFIVACLGASTLLVLASDTLACGDKFLVPGRGPNFGQAYASMQPGRILIYRNSQTKIAELLGRELEETLERVGHSVDIVESPEALQSALNTGRYDVLLADVDDLKRVAEQHASAQHAPVGLPVVYKASWMEVNQLKEKFQAVLNAPSRVSQVLAVVDEAVSLSHAALASAG